MHILWHLHCKKTLIMAIQLHQVVRTNPLPTSLWYPSIFPPLSACSITIIQPAVNVRNDSVNYGTLNM